MRNRGFIGSFSTSALLVGAALSILVVVSAIVAFEGWPGPTGETSTETFLLTDGAGPASETPAPRELVLDPPRASRSAAAAGSRARKNAAGGAAASGSAAGRASTSAPEPVDPAGAAVAPQPDLVPDPVPGGGGTGTLEGSVGGDALGGSVGGGTIGDTVDRATDAIDGGVKRLAPVTDGVRGLQGGSTGAPGDLSGGL